MNQVFHTNYTVGENGKNKNIETEIDYLIKRDGKKADFNSHKIREAIRKAFLSQGLSLDDIFDKLTSDAVSVIHLTYSNEHLPTVEDIQDIVEKIIIKHNYPEVAKAYIIYRQEHTKLRQEAVLSKIRSNSLQLKKRNGETTPFHEEIIRKKINNLAFGLNHIRIDNLVNDICKTVYDGITTTEIDTLSLNSIKTRIEQHYDYSSLAARYVLDGLYGDVLGVSATSPQCEKLYRSNFKDYLNQGIELELINTELKDQFDIEAISAALKPERDFRFHYLGVQTILDRYLLRTRKNHSIFELPGWMWMRVAMGLALNEEEKEKRAIEFYNTLSQFHLVSSTPTLFNSGTNHSQMSSCYLNTVDDSLEGIFKNYADNAQLSKWAGGIGTDWTAVRSTGSDIKGTNGKSSGIIPFVKIFNDVAIAVNQGGKRKGAMAAYLENWHLDIEDFLELRKNTGDERRRTHDIHTAVFISDLFMKRVQSKSKWTLFTPDQVPELHDLYGKEFENKYIEYEQANLSGSKTVNAADLWKKTLTMLYETGHPWITYKDASNIRSPQDHVGTVHCSNLCTEITLNTSKDETAVCNLASINLSAMISDGKLDENLIKETVLTGMRMLDNVVDLNYYPTIEAKNSNLRHRPVGLGMMGYQDALYQLDITFDSEDNVAFADRSMEMVSYYAILGSSMLAKERGAYSTYAGSKWDRGMLPIDTLDELEKERGEKLKIDRNMLMDWSIVRAHIKEYGMRNSNCMAIAPTATIANISGVVPCVEPIFKNIYMKENLSGNFCVVNRYLIDHLERIGRWNPQTLAQIKYNDGSVANIQELPIEVRRKFKEVFEISPEWVVKAAAKRSKWIDQSASTNLFMTTKSGREISNVYQLVWEYGMKTTYYLRTLAASQITKATTLEIENKEEEPKPVGMVSEQPATGEVKACLLSDPDCEACQ